MFSYVTMLSQPLTSQSQTKRKNLRKFLFSHFFVVPQKVYDFKAFKAFIKPFEALQKNLKIKI